MKADAYTPAKGHENLAAQRARFKNPLADVDPLAVALDHADEESRLCGNCGAWVSLNPNEPTGARHTYGKGNEGCPGAKRGPLSEATARTLGNLLLEGQR